MYRCQICDVVSRPSQGLLRHVDYRPDGTILKETPVCKKCLDGLGLGLSVADLTKQRGNAKQPAVTKPTVKQDVQKLAVKFTGKVFSFKKS